MSAVESGQGAKLGFLCRCVGVGPLRLQWRRGEVRFPPGVLFVHWEIVQMSMRCSMAKVASDLGGGVVRAHPLGEVGLCRGRGSWQ